MTIESKHVAALRVVYVLSALACASLPFNAYKRGVESGADQMSSLHIFIDLIGRLTARGPSSAEDDEQMALSRGVEMLNHALSQYLEDGMLQTDSVDLIRRDLKNLERCLQQEVRE